MVSIVCILACGHVADLVSCPMNIVVYGHTCTLLFEFLQLLLYKFTNSHKLCDFIISRPKYVHVW